MQEVKKALDIIGERNFESPQTDVCDSSSSLAGQCTFANVFGHYFYGQRHRYHPMKPV